MAWSAVPADAGTSSTTANAIARETATSIRALIDGKLDPSIDADTLFDVALGDEKAVALEAGRLRRVLPVPADRSSSTPASTSDIQPPAGVSADAWEARLELDRARLDFYSLPAAQRSSLLAAHRQLHETGQPSALQESIEAASRADAAEDRQRQVLADLQSTRSEAERLVAEEQARLLGILAKLAEQQSSLALARNRQGARTDRTLALHRRVRQALDGTAGSPQEVDALYQELRSWLRESRQQLAAALSAPPVTAVPVEQSSDSLAALTIEVDQSENRRLLDAARTMAAQVFSQATAANDKHLAQLYSEVQSLNDDRLALLPRLSPQLRKALTGTDATGLDQASAEFLQLSLVIRYHVRSTVEWLRHGSLKQLLGATFGTTTKTVLQLLLVLGAFFWGQRLARRLLSDWELSLAEDARKARSLEVPRFAGVLRLAQRILRPLSFLLLLLALDSLLPATTATLLEVQLVATVLKWTLGGWLVVVALDSIARQRAMRVAVGDHSATDALRLRSLRLLGGTVVVIGLILSTTRLIVGAGTIYDWVLQLSVWATVPIGLLLVRWWRQTIFQRMGRSRRRNALQHWVIANQQGWRSFPAAVVGGVFLFAKGAFVIVRDWAGGFEPVKRVLAYLFRQQLDRMAEAEQQHASMQPLAADQYDLLSPGNHDGQLLESAIDEPAEEFARRIRRQGRGVFAVIGERGSGRTTVLRQVAAGLDGAVFLDCPFGGLVPLVTEMAAALGQAGASGLDSLDITLPGKPRVMVVDNAHRLIHPVMGGMAEFDQLLEFARRNSSDNAWIISLDRMVWRFVSQARSTAFLFDDVLLLEGWTELEIATLLRKRSQEAGLDARFDLLVTDLPPDPDDPERRDALDHAARSYFRLVWDYADGNPGVALHTWRASLGVAADGQVHVTQFRVPDPATFGSLPDSAVFVLRSVLQLERAREEIVTRATMINRHEVETALRFGLQQGYLELVDGLYTVAWAWYRPLTRFLQRRHLLARQ